MTITVADVIVWAVVGAIAGSLVGRLVMWRKQGFGYLMNLGIGLVGALVGGGIVRLFNINTGILEQISISLEDIVAAVVGALLFVFVLWIVQWFRKRNSVKSV
ncbi:MAG: GlsB/YeaQ/YmgE family stress response membrane protein [Planctomycetota bacterium]